MLHIFLKNKLISSDAIVPVLLDARRQGLSEKIRFYVQSPKTIKALRENTVLWAALNQLGEVILAVPENRSVGAIVRHRFAALGWLSKLLVSTALGKARIVHFGQLYTSKIYRPLIALRERSVLVVEGAFAGYSKAQTSFGDLDPKRQINFDISVAPNIAVFEVDSELANRVRAKGREPIVIGKPHALTGWLEFLKEQSRNAFPPDHKEIFSVILGTFGKLHFFPEEDSAEILLEETLDLLVENGGGRPIYLKPHVITEREKLDRILAKYKDAPIYVTNLHPSVLAERAVFTISNYYSTVLSTVHGLGGTTVEYTEYSEEAFLLSGGESVRADSVTHFILRDRTRLKALIVEACQMGRPRVSIDDLSVPAGLVDWLGGQNNEIRHL